jgi:hypothetical protein
MLDGSRSSRRGPPQSPIGSCATGRNRLRRLRRPRAVKPSWPANRHGRAGAAGRLLLLGCERHLPDTELPDHRHPDGRVRLGYGLDLRSCHGVHLGAVAADEAGLGSAVNDSTRLLGGTLGVAVIGSIYASMYNSRLGTTLSAALPHGLTHLVHQSIGAAFGVSSQLTAHGQPTAAAGVRQAAANAFDHGLSIGCVAAGAVASPARCSPPLFCLPNPRLPAQPPSACPTPAQPGPLVHPADAAEATSDRKDRVR